jgi:FkbM family methyltransferase
MAGAAKRRLFESPECQAWRRAARISEQTPRFTAGTIQMMDYDLRYADLLTFCPQWKDIFIDRSVTFHTSHAAPRIFDCGANVGLASLFYKRLYPDARISAFEADPALAAILRENLTRNDAADVDVQPAAVWTANGTVTFRSEGADSGTIESLAGEMAGRSMEVSAVRLADWLAREPEPVDMLKLDIEGAEVSVLNDCHEQLHKVRALLLEIHEFDPERRHSPQILQLLDRAGFRYAVTHVIPLHWRDRHATARSPFPHRSAVFMQSVSAWRE